MEGEKIVFRATGVAVSAYVKAGDFETDVALGIPDTGEIVTDPTGITLKGLKIPLISFDEIHLGTTLASGKRLWLHSDRLGTPGSVKVVNLEVEAHADRAFKRIEIRRFVIEKIELDALQLELPDDGVVITVRELATLNTIKLEGPAGAAADPFVITRDVGPTGKTTLAGVASIDSTTFPKVTAYVKDRFNGAVDLSSQKATVGFLASGGTVIDISKPRVKMKDPKAPATLGSATETIYIEEVGAEKIHVEGGKVTVTGGGVTALVYKRPGVEVTVKKVDLPGDIELTDITGKIPDLTITDADVMVDLAQLGSSGGSGGSLDLGDLRPLVDSLQGDLSMTVYVRVSIALPYLPDLDDQDLKIPVALHFADGKLNFQDLTKALRKTIQSKDADESDDTSHTVEYFAEDPQFWMDGDDLVFGLKIAESVVLDVGPPAVYRKELVRWNLFGGEITQAHKENLVRLYRLSMPAPDPDKDPAEPDALHLDTLEFQDIVTDLSVRSTKPIPLTFKAGGMRGDIMSRRTR